MHFASWTLLCQQQKKQCFLTTLIEQCHTVYSYRYVNSLEFNGCALEEHTSASQSEEVIASNRCTSLLGPRDFSVLWSLPNLWRPVVSHESSVTKNKLPAHWTGHNNKRCHYFHGNWSHLRREKSIVNIIVSGVEPHIEEVWFVMHAAHLATLLSGEVVLVFEDQAEEPKLCEGSCMCKKSPKLAHKFWKREKNTLHNLTVS